MCKVLCVVFNIFFFYSNLIPYNQIVLMNILSRDAPGDLDILVYDVCIDHLI